MELQFPTPLRVVLLCFCNSVSADRIVMAASRLLRAVAAFVILFSCAAGSRKSYWSGCMKAATVICQQIFSILALMIFLLKIILKKVILVASGPKLVTSGSTTNCLSQQLCMVPSRCHMPLAQPLCFSQQLCMVPSKCHMPLAQPLCLSQQLCMVPSKCHMQLAQPLCMLLATSMAALFPQQTLQNSKVAQQLCLDSQKAYTFPKDKGGEVLCTQHGRNQMRHRYVFFFL